MKRTLIAVLLAGAVAVSTTKPAEARWGWGWGLGAFAIGALIGAALCGAPLIPITIRPRATFTAIQLTATVTGPPPLVMATRPIATAMVIRPTAATIGPTMAATTAHTLARRWRGGSRYTAPAGG